MLRLGMCSNNLNCFQNKTSRLYHIRRTYEEMYNVKLKLKFKIYFALRASLTDEARRAKYILNFIFGFTLYISYTCVECGKDVMSYFASSSRCRYLVITNTFGCFLKNIQNMYIYFKIK